MKPSQTLRSKIASHHRRTVENAPMNKLFTAAVVRRDMKLDEQRKQRDQAAREKAWLIYGMLVKDGHLPAPNFDLTGSDRAQKLDQLTMEIDFTICSLSDAIKLLE